jgi:YfiH family protein
VDQRLMGRPERGGAANDRELVFELPDGGRALFTTRAEGNLSTGAGDRHEHGLRHRGAICESHSLPWVCSSRQVHGAVVNVVDRLTGAQGSALAIDADGHATALRNLGVMVMAADCLPVALGCDGAVAMVHAGWRGLVAGVLEQGVRTLRQLGHGARIVAIVGPCAGACCYDVGPEVHRAFAGEHAHGRHIDLRAIAHERLVAVGVDEIGDVDVCTICDERFFSYRREGAHAGRQAGIAWLS